MNSSEPSPIKWFFEFARTRVDVSAFSDFAPNDPGHFTYVELLTKIYYSGKIAQEHYYLTDAYFGTDETNDMSEETRQKLCGYRVFLNAIGLMMVEQNLEEPYSLNYIAFEVIQDLKSFEPENKRKISDVFKFVADLLEQRKEPECLFFYFGQILINQEIGDHDVVAKYAATLIEKENQFIHDSGVNYIFSDHGRFLLSASCGFDQYYKQWEQLLINLPNPEGNEHLQLISELAQS